MTGHILRAEVKAGRRKRIGQAGIWVAGDRRIRLLRELGQEGIHQIGAERAVEPDRERVHVLNRIPKCLNGLRRDHRFAAPANGSRNHDRQLFTVLIEDLADGDQRGFSIQRVKDRFHQYQIDATGDEGARLLGIGCFNLIEGDDTETRIVGIGRIGKRYRQRPHRPGNEALTRGRVRDAVSRFTALPRRLLVDLPGQVVKKRIIDDLLVELGILATAMFTRIVHKKFTLSDAGSAEGVGLDDVRTGLQKPAMNIADHLRLSEGEEIAVVQQIFRRVLESLAANVRFRHSIGADRGAHRTVNDGDSTLDDLLKRMLASYGHFTPTV